MDEMHSPHTDAIELPAPSYWPIITAFSLLLVGIGLIFSLIITLVGVVMLLVSLVAWTLENRADGDVNEMEEEMEGAVDE